MPKTFAFVTYQGQPAITVDDALAVELLRERGIDVIAVPWQANVEWNRFDAVVLRSCWDYYNNIHQFLGWLKKLRERGINLINPYGILCWNAEKTYLKDLESAGATVVSTVIVPMNSKIGVTDLLKDRGWDRAVIKPTISGTSMHTWVTSSGTADADQARLDGLLIERSMMLQEYLPEIETEGELSLIFFDGEFSHAVRKVPKSGDFRVQSDFGGSWSAVNPTAEIVRQSSLVLESVGHKSTYARVDMVLHEGSFLLMELELIERQLFLESDPGAPSRFAMAIQNRLGDHGISQDI